MFRRHISSGPAQTMHTLDSSSSGEANGPPSSGPTDHQQQPDARGTFPAAKARASPLLLYQAPRGRAPSPAKGSHGAALGAIGGMEAQVMTGSPPSPVTSEHSVHSSGGCSRAPTHLTSKQHTDRRHTHPLLPSHAKASHDAARASATAAAAAAAAAAALEALTARKNSNNRSPTGSVCEPGAASPPAAATADMATSHQHAVSAAERAAKLALGTDASVQQRTRTVQQERVEVGTGHEGHAPPPPPAPVASRPSSGGAFPSPFLVAAQQQERPGSSGSPRADQHVAPPTTPAAPSAVASDPHTTLMLAQAAMAQGIEVEAAMLVANILQQPGGYGALQDMLAGQRQTPVHSTQSAARPMSDPLVSLSASSASASLSVQQRSISSDSAGPAFGMTAQNRSLETRSVEASDMGSRIGEHTDENSAGSLLLMSSGSQAASYPIETAKSGLAPVKPADDVRAEPAAVNHEVAGGQPTPPLQISRLLGLLEQRQQNQAQEAVVQREQQSTAPTAAALEWGAALGGHANMWNAPTTGAGAPNNNPYGSADQLQADAAQLLASLQMDQAASGVQDLFSSTPIATPPVSSPNNNPYDLLSSAEMALLLSSQQSVTPEPPAQLSMGLNSTSAGPHMPPTPGRGFWLNAPASAPDSAQGTAGLVGFDVSSLIAAMDPSAASTTANNLNSFDAANQGLLQSFGSNIELSALLGRMGLGDAAAGGQTPQATMFAASAAAAAAGAVAAALEAGSPSASRVGKGWEDLAGNVRDRVLHVTDKCSPYVKLTHFDAGVRHWLVQLTTLFGEDAAIQGLAGIEAATNLEGVRNMRAFITTRLIDHYEQLVFSQDPEGYARRRLLPEQYALLCELVHGGQGLQWSHFDPKVLETVRDMGNLEYTRARLQRLTAKELATVQNVPAYIFTLLSKRGRTAKQAAAAKTASEIALMTFPSLGATSFAPQVAPLGQAPGLLGLPMQQQLLLQQQQATLQQQASMQQQASLQQAQHGLMMQQASMGNMGSWAAMSATGMYPAGSPAGSPGPRSFGAPLDLPAHLAPATPLRPPPPPPPPMGVPSPAAANNRAGAQVSGLRSAFSCGLMAPSSPQPGSGRNSAFQQGPQQQVVQHRAGSGFLETYYQQPGVDHHVAFNPSGGPRSPAPLDLQHQQHQHQTLQLQHQQNLLQHQQQDLRWGIPNYMALRHAGSLDTAGLNRAAAAGVAANAYGGLGHNLMLNHSQQPHGGFPSAAPSPVGQSRFGAQALAAAAGGREQLLSAFSGRDSIDVMSPRHAMLQQRLSAGRAASMPLQGGLLRQDSLSLGE